MIFEESTSCDASCEASPKAEGSDIDSPRGCRTPEPEPGTPDNTPLAVPPAYMLLCASALAHAAAQQCQPGAMPTQQTDAVHQAPMMQIQQGAMMPQMMMQQSTQQVPLMNMLQMHA